MTYAEHPRRTAAELRTFDLPRRQELFLRARLWKDLRSFSARLGPGRHLVPLDFRHFMELTDAILGCKPAPEQRVLVLGAADSPLGLYLASKGCQVQLLDLDPRVQQQAHYARLAGLGPLLAKGQLVIERFDGRTLDFPDGSFDLVFALSCVDRTREEADIVLFREALRVTKIGGLMSCSLRYGPRWQEGQSGRRPYRIYTEGSIQDRLLDGQPLNVLRKFYYAEDTVGLGKLWDKFPPLLRDWLLGWTVYPIGQAVAIGDVSTRKNATRTVLLLQKHDGSSHSTSASLPSVTVAAP